MSSGKDSQESRLSSPDGDNNVPYLLSNILTKSQVHKENDDQVHEDVEADTTRAKDDGMDNHDQKLIEGMVSKNEINLLICATNSKKQKLITLGSQSVNDKFSLIKENVNMEQVADKLRKYMIFVVGDGNIHDCISLLGIIRLSLRLLDFLKFKLYQMDVHSASLNRYLNKKVEECYFTSIMLNIMENNSSNNINNVVKNFVNVDEDVILMIKDVSNRSTPSNEVVTKDVDLGNLSFLNKDIVLNCLCQMRMLPKEGLISEEDVQFLEEVIVKDDGKVLMCVVNLSDITMEHIAHQMQFDL